MDKEASVIENPTYDFYDVKHRKKVTARITEKVSYGDINKMRYAFKGKTEDGRSLTAFVAKEVWDKVSLEDINEAKSDTFTNKDDIGNSSPNISIYDDLLNELNSYGENSIDSIDSKELVALENLLRKSSSDIPQSSQFITKITTEFQVASEWELAVSKIENIFHLGLKIFVCADLHFVNDLVDSDKRINVFISAIATRRGNALNWEAIELRNTYFNDKQNKPILTNASGLDAPVMYNLIISDKQDSWNGQVFTIPKERCVTARENTEDQIAKELGEFSEESIAKLKKLPCVFAYESPLNLAPKFGYIVSVTLSGALITLEYELYESPNFLTQQSLTELASQLGIGGEYFELDRTYWAVKGVNIKETLESSGLEFPQFKQEKYQDYVINNNYFSDDLKSTVWICAQLSQDVNLMGGNLRLLIETMKTVSFLKRDSFVELYNSYYPAYDTVHVPRLSYYDGSKVYKYEDELENTYRTRNGLKEFSVIRLSSELIDILTEAKRIAEVTRVKMLSYTVEVHHVVIAIFKYRTHNTSSITPRLKSGLKSEDFFEKIKKLIDPDKENIGSWQEVLNKISSKVISDILENELGVLHKNDFNRFMSDELSEVDELGVQPDAQGMARLIMDKEFKGSLAIGVFGPWGSGKSNFFKFLKNEVNQIAKESIADDKELFCDRVCHIEFNAWHYHDTNLWASLASQIFGQLKGHLTGEEASAYQRILKEISLKNHECEDIEKQIKELCTEKEKIQQQGIYLEAIRYALKSCGFQTSDKLLESIKELNNGTDNIKELYGKIKEEDNSWNNVFENFRLPHALSVVAIVFLFLILNIFDLVDDISAAVSAGLSAILVPITFISTHLKKAFALKRKLNELAGTDEKIDAQINEKKTFLEIKEAEISDLEIRKRKYESGEYLLEFLEEKAGCYERNLSLVSLLRKDLETLVELLKTNEQAGSSTHADEVQPLQLRIDRVILYIDDLDRCDKKIVMEVLQAVHLLLGFELFIAVVGIDTRWVHNALKDTYELDSTPNKELNNSKENIDDMQNETDEARFESLYISPQNYLEKIIQIPYCLPMLNRGFLNKLVAKLPIEDLKNKKAGIEIKNNTKVERNYDVSKDSSVSNERKVNDTELEEEKQVQSKVESEALIEHVKLTMDEVNHLGSILCADITPRVIKRMINIYRIIRSSLNRQQLQKFTDGEYKVLWFLLCIQAEYPHSYQEVLEHIRTFKSSNSDNGLAMWIAAVTEEKDEFYRFGKMAHKQCQMDCSAESLRLYIEKVCQYSFDTEKHRMICGLG